MKRYFVTTVSLTIIICFLVAVFNVIVDPYVLYRYQQADTERLSRIEQFYHMRITKPWHVARLSPEQVVLGTSITAVISPHPVWPRASSYNLSIPGLTPYEMLRFLEHADANGPVDKLMLGLDFAAHVRPVPVTQPGFEENRMASEPGDLDALQFKWQRVKDIVDTLFSLPAFHLSVSALSPLKDVRRRYFKDGSWDTVSDQYIGQSGFILNGKVNIYALRNEPADLDFNLDILADTLRFAHRNRIETRLFITPIHIFMVDLWHCVGYEQWWRDFHKRLVAVNEAVALEFGVDPFPLYGFNHVPGVVDEPIRSAANARHSAFDDGLHFRKKFGNQIMAAVWSDTPGIGYELNPGSVEAYLAEVDRMRLEFEGANRKLTARLRSSISPGLAQRPDND